MKLKCNHDRRVLVLPSSTTVHRSDGSECLGSMSIGGNRVTKMFTKNDAPNIKKGTLVLGVDKQ